VNQRNPSTDNVLRAHLYNNFMQRIASYGNYSRGGTNMVLENSVFEDVKDPYHYDDGTLVAIGNIVRDSSGQQESSGSSYSVFDPHDYYDYVLDPADEVESLLERCSGPRPDLGL
jgi:pectate lyase